MSPNPLMKLGSKLLHPGKDTDKKHPRAPSPEGSQPRTSTLDSFPRHNTSDSHRSGHSTPPHGAAAHQHKDHKEHHKSLIDRIVPQPLRPHNSRRSSTSSDSSDGHNHTDEALEKKKAKRQAKEEKRRKAKEAAAEIDRHHREAYDQDELNVNYGEFAVVRKTEPRKFQRDDIEDMANKSEGTVVVFRARIHHIRPKSANLAFIVFRQHYNTVQGVLTVRQGQISQNMVRWTERLPRETTVLVKGILQTPKSKDQEVHSATIHQVEVLIDQIFVVGTVTEPLPVHVEDIDRALLHTNAGGDAAVSISNQTRLENRLIDLRGDASQAIFRIQAGVGRFFRSYLDSQKFTEIHSSKFQGGGTESGASVFKVDYFGRAAYLAQSPQLGKQMAIAADLERVYEIGPVFRAENSNTHRHLTEFTGLDLEMTIEEDYHEVVDMLDNALKSIFRGLQSEYRRELDTVRKFYPSEDLVFPEKTVMLHFKDGVKLLNDSGWKENDEPIPEYEDFSTATERRLGQLVKEKYGTDYYILDKFPRDARPFYTMPDAEDPKLSNSCDFFIRGEEILSGGQRIHNAPMLEKRMKEAGLDPNTMADYVSGFRQGMPPHGGGGIGLERVVFLFLKLGNIRWASLYPKDPRSFPRTDKEIEDVVFRPADGDALRGPAMSTLDFVKKKDLGERPPLPKLADLVPAYGDSAATSWFDPYWTVWQHNETGAMCGYRAASGYAICWGRPLCDDSQLVEVIKAFTNHLKSQKLKIVFASVDEETQKAVGEELGWSCLIAAAEQRIDPRKVSLDSAEKQLRAKINRAEREGVKVHTADAELSEELKHKLEVQMKAWKSKRTGTQMYTASLRPWDDPEHRRYFYATDKDDQLVGLVVLAQLSKRFGFQVKYSLDFPNAPAGTIEMIMFHAIDTMGKAGVNNATFGGAAPPQLTPIGKDWGMRIKLLSKTYGAIVKQFNLLDRAGFKEKFGAESDGCYVCFPKNSLGLKGVEALMSVLQDNKPDDFESRKEHN